MSPLSDVILREDAVAAKEATARILRRASPFTLKSQGEATLSPVGYENGLAKSSHSC
jgi:hypothetical protein